MPGHIQHTATPCKAGAVDYMQATGNALGRRQLAKRSYAVQSAPGAVGFKPDPF